MLYVLCFDFDARCKEQEEHRQEGQMSIHTALTALCSVCMYAEAEAEAATVYYTRSVYRASQDRDVHWKCKPVVLRLQFAIRAHVQRVARFSLCALCFLCLCIFCSLCLLLVSYSNGQLTTKN